MASFVLDGNICTLLAAKDHVNVFLYDDGTVPTPPHLLTARRFRFRRNGAAR